MNLQPFKIIYRVHKKQIHKPLKSCVNWERLFSYIENALTTEESQKVACYLILEKKKKGYDENPPQPSGTLYSIYRWSSLFQPNKCKAEKLKRFR